MATPPAGYVEVTFVCQATGSPRFSTFTLGIDDASFITHSPLQIATAMYNMIALTGAPLNAANMSSEYKFLRVRATKMLEDGPLTADYSQTTVGTKTTKCPPNNSAVLVTKNTASGGRRNRGRLYAPPTYVDEATTDATGYMVPADLTAIQAQWTQFSAALFTANYQPVLFHDAAPFTPTQIIGLTVQQQLATQRRRMRK